MINKVVVHFQDGRVSKGTTNDFQPGRDIFHLAAGGTAKPERVIINQLKAIFFVKDFYGNPEKIDSQQFSQEKSLGKRVEVKFKDGERLTGSAQAYHPDKPGFFLFPADPTSNIDRCFVVKAGASEINLL